MSCLSKWAVHQLAGPVKCSRLCVVSCLMFMIRNPCVEQRWFTGLAQPKDQHKHKPLMVLTAAGTRGESTVLIVTFFVPMQIYS